MQLYKVLLICEQRIIQDHSVSLTENGNEGPRLEHTEPQTDGGLQ